MTLLAHTLAQGLMHIIIKHRFCIRTVWIVTGRTVGLLDRVVDVLDLKGLFARIVALQAKFRRLLLQQARVFS